MERLEEHIREVTTSVWRRMLGLSAEPTSTPAAPADEMLLGSVAVTGAWRGVVRLCCSPALARRAASIMFAVEPRDATDAQVRDALAELANVAGGSLKALFPSPSSLSVPTVGDRGDLGEGRLLAQVAFECQGEPLWVACVEHDAERILGSRSER